MEKMPHVLLVNDNPLLLGQMQAILEAQGHTTFGVKNAQQALEYLERNDVSLVVTEVMMPVMNGIELSKALGGRVPIVMVTDDSVRWDGKVEDHCHCLIETSNVNHHLGKAVSRAFDLHWASVNQYGKMAA
jgi:CheY-like chemotaxis protein